MYWPGEGGQICGVSIRTYFRSDKELSHLNIALSLRRIRVNLPQFEGSVHIVVLPHYCGKIKVGRTCGGELRQPEGA